MKKATVLRLMASTDDRAVHVTIDAPAHDLIVRMDRSAVITGTVRVSPGGSTPADGSCRAENAAASRVFDPGVRMEGERFRIQVAPRGHWKLSLDWEGFSTTHVECDVVPGETTYVGEVTLTPMAGVTGRVVDEDGAGVPNASVSIPKIAGARADASGNFRVRREAPGRVVVEAFTDGLCGAVVLEPDASLAGVTLVVHPIRRIEVLVEDRIDGPPRVQRVVLVRSSDGVEFDKCGTVPPDPSVRPPRTRRAESVN